MEAVLELVKNVLGMGTEGLSVEYQESGLTNRNYIVSSSSGKFVVRISGEKSSELGINRRAEFAAMKEAEKAGIGAEMLYFSEENGDMVTRYIHGRGLFFEEFGQQEVIGKCAGIIKRVHSLPEIPYEFSPYKDICERIATAAQRKFELPDYLEQLVDRLLRIEEKRLKYSNLYRGLCHNDPFANNFLDESGVLRLIDWEYAGMGDIFFDLACIGTFFNEEQKEFLLKTYFGEVTEELLQGMREMGFVSSFWNAMWAVLQEKKAENEFDYSQMARNIFASLKSFCN